MTDVTIEVVEAPVVNIDLSGPGAQLSAQYAATAGENAALAEQWANEDVDVVVADGKYSGKHYATKAEDFADAAAEAVLVYEVVDALPVAAAPGTVYLIPDPAIDLNALVVSVVDELPAAPEENTLYFVPEAEEEVASDLSDVNIPAGTSRATAQQMIYDAEGKKAVLLPGEHLLGPINVGPNTVLEILPGAVVGWHPTATLTDETGIIQVHGTSGLLKPNVHVINRGIIDGDLSHRDDETFPTKLEGINYKFTTDGSITGGGVIRNITEDSIDLDACRRMKVDGMTVIDGGGFAVHLGGNVGDYIADQSVIVSNIFGENCGHVRFVSGIDMNPNWGTVNWSNITMKDCWRNFEFYEPSETNEVVNNRVAAGLLSIDTGDVVHADTGMEHTLYCQINGSIWLNGVLLVSA